jgi:hypothetical protein
MQRKRFPFREYLWAPGVISSFGIAWFAAQQWLQAQPWWVAVPWPWIIFGLFFFLAGTLHADLWNKNSQLRRWWRDRHCVFEVMAVSTNHTWNDASRYNTERVEIWCSLKFIRPQKKAALTVRVTSPLGSHNPQTNLIINKSLGDIPKDFQQRVVLGNISISSPLPPEEIERRKSSGQHLGARHNVWGEAMGLPDIAQGQTTMIPGSKNLIEISVGRQTYSIFATLLNETREDQTRIFFLTEDDETPL